MTSAYTPSQISDYLDYISFPTQLRSAPRDILFLRTLHTHQITTIPYDNLSLHYSPTHTNSLDPQVLYRKFTTHGRGGYCMETAIFYRHILLALGFNTYLAGARIRLRTENGVPEGDFIGYVHCTNIVTFAETGEKFSCDVGFGGDGLTAPMPLVDGAVRLNLGTQEVRLVHRPFPALGRWEEGVEGGEGRGDAPGPLFWFFQYRNDSTKDWNTYYAFAEMEFLEHDLEMMNWWTSTCLASFQTKTVLVVKFVRSEGQSEVVGKHMLVNGRVKRNMGGKTELVLECRTEEERVDALKKYFGIGLTEEQRNSIRGYRTELA